MSQTASVWVVLLVALVAANLPFLNERLFGAVPLSTAHKSLAIRFGELVVEPAGTLIVVLRYPVQTRPAFGAH